ncbi:DUF1995 family protein [Synechococcus sp. MIT S1220]|uniref:DUF1995 family protein n=1 Tax=Synechococcus sp. MIT S1220 TaxID=3082549 RepID=UPI0039B0158C
MTTTEPAVQPLPSDLAAAEQAMHASLLAALDSGDGSRWGAALKFENLRLLPVALRLARALMAGERPVTVLWPDAGAAALARRDASDLADCILDFRQWMRRSAEEPSDELLLAVMPTPADYEEFLGICEAHHGQVAMLNGRLEDAAVGIGSVARERRRGFVSSWKQAYWLEPLDGGALMRCFPADWRIYRSDPDGYRQVAVFESRPDPDTIATSLAGEAGDGLKQQLNQVDRFIDGLRN